MVVEAPFFFSQKMLLHGDRTGVRLRSGIRCFESVELGLLRTCRQIQEEATPIWLKQNHFHVVNDPLNIHLLLRFADICKRFQIICKMSVILDCPSARRIYDDLQTPRYVLRWCEKLFSSRPKCALYTTTYPRATLEDTIHSLFRITRDSADTSWEDLSKKLVPLIETYEFQLRRENDSILSGIRTSEIKPWFDASCQCSDCSWTE